MSLSIVYTRATLGIQAPLVTVETHLSGGLPGLSIVGLPEAAVRESKERVRSAILNSQFEFPTRRITINLAPADLPKEGGRYDLPIALGILAANHQIPQAVLNQYEFAGELALSGELRSITGALALALGTRCSNRALILPEESALEASFANNIPIYAASHLLEVFAYLNQRTNLKLISSNIQHSLPRIDIDFSEIQGQHHAKHGLEIAAAGGHSLLMIGPPGTGKTMLAARLPSILPPLSLDESLEVMAIHSLISANPSLMECAKRPFRAPHHTISTAALVGGGLKPKPGEVSLAHRGILFLDELPEFSRNVLEGLREPIESGKIFISRTARKTEFPARFQLIAAMNPCPCGYLGDQQFACRCSPLQIQHYRTRLSGPLLDRIDMHIEVPRPFNPLFTSSEEIMEENSLRIRERVCKTIAIQQKRSLRLNAELKINELKQFCKIDQASELFMKNAMETLGLSLRSYHRILRVARTIADMAEESDISVRHLKEALSLRKLDRMMHAS